MLAALSHKGRGKKGCLSLRALMLPLVPAQAGTQSFCSKCWIPACAGMNGSARRGAYAFTPARIFFLNSAIAEIVSFVSGRSTGSLRSADKSAAL